MALSLYVTVARGFPDAPNCTCNLLQMLTFGTSTAQRFSTKELYGCGVPLAGVTPSPTTDMRSACTGAQSRAPLRFVQRNRPINRNLSNTFHPYLLSNHLIKKQYYSTNSNGCSGGSSCVISSSDSGRNALSSTITVSSAMSPCSARYGSIFVSSKYSVIS